MVTGNRRRRHTSSLHEASLIQIECACSLNRRRAWKERRVVRSRRSRRSSSPLLAVAESVSSPAVIHYANQTYAIWVGTFIEPILRGCRRARDCRECWRRVVAILNNLFLIREELEVRLSIAITILAALIFLNGCSDPAANKSKAMTGAPAQVASPAAAAQGHKYQITPQNSKIEFVGSQVTGHHDGSFGDFSGRI